MTTMVTVDVHDTVPDDMLFGEIMAWHILAQHWNVAEARWVRMHWGKRYSHWHMPIDLVTITKEQTT